MAIDEDPGTRLLGRRTAVRNRVLEVHLDHVRDAAGHEVEDFLVVEPRRKTADGATGVAILPVLDGRLVLLRLYRHALGDFTWEIPRGFVEEGEPHSRSALRELEEETGLVCRDEDLRDLGTLEPEPGILRARTRLFAALSCRSGPREPEGELGHCGRRELSLSEALSEIREGRLREATTLVCILRLRLEGFLDREPPGDRAGSPVR